MICEGAWYGECFGQAGVSGFVGLRNLVCINGEWVIDEWNDKLGNYWYDEGTWDVVCDDSPSLGMARLWQPVRGRYCRPRLRAPLNWM